MVLAVPVARGEFGVPTHEVVKCVDVIHGVNLALDVPVPVPDSCNVTALSPLVLGESLVTFSEAANGNATSVRCQNR